MTSFANKMQIFLWQIATVIPIKGTRTSVIEYTACVFRSVGCTPKCAKQAIKLRGKIQKSLPQTIVMVNDFVWKPGILTLVLVPLIGMTIAICHKNICILFINSNH